MQPRTCGQARANLADHLGFEPYRSVRDQHHLSLRLGAHTTERFDDGVAHLRRAARSKLHQPLPCLASRRSGRSHGLRLEATRAIGELDELELVVVVQGVDGASATRRACSSGSPIIDPLVSSSTMRSRGSALTSTEGGTSVTTPKASPSSFPTPGAAASESPTSGAPTTQRTTTSRSSATPPSAADSTLAASATCVAIACDNE